MFKMTSLWCHKHVKMTFYKKLNIFTNFSTHFLQDRTDLLSISKITNGYFWKKCYFSCFCRISSTNSLLNDVITTSIRLLIKNKYFYRVPLKIFYKIGWLLQHFNLKFVVHSCLLSLNNQKMAKNVKNDVIMT